MATQRQLAANRRNASHSTGPRTEKGRARSSRNSYRHGLTGAILADPRMVERVAALAAVISETRDFQGCANQLAEAQLDLQRIRKARADVIAILWIDGFDDEGVRGLARFDRYERLAWGRRKRAIPPRS